MIEFAMKEKKECNVNIGFRNKILKPKINIKINDFKSEAELYTPKKIYKLIQSSFNDFFNNDFDFSKLNIKDVREVIINLIFYSTEMKNNNELLPTNFLIYSLYFLKDLWANNKIIFFFIINEKFIIFKNAILIYFNNI